MVTSRLDEIFSISYGNKFDMNKMQREGGDVAFVGRRGTNQGVSGFVPRLPDVPPYPAGLLTVALGGAILATYVQQKPFYTAQNVAVLRPRDEDTSPSGVRQTERFIPFSFRPSRPRGSLRCQSRGWLVLMLALSSQHQISLDLFHCLLLRV
jgi:hypothetical protein